MSAPKAGIVAEVVQREPYLDGSPNPMKTLRWTLPNCEDDLSVGTKLYAAAPEVAQGAVAEVTHATADNYGHRRRIRWLTDAAIPVGAKLYTTPHQPTEAARDREKAFEEILAMLGLRATMQEISDYVLHEYNRAKGERNSDTEQPAESTSTELKDYKIDLEQRILRPVGESSFDIRSFLDAVRASNNDVLGLHARQAALGIYVPRTAEELAFRLAICMCASKSGSGAQAPSDTFEHLLRAMVNNYAHGHRWDQLDADACEKAANEIRDLRRVLLKAAPDWRIEMFERLRTRTQELGFVGLCEAIDAHDQSPEAVAERAQIRLDAERYRLLRETRVNPHAVLACGADLDATLDAGLSAASDSDPA